MKSKLQRDQEDELKRARERRERFASFALKRACALIQEGTEGVLAVHFRVWHALTCICRQKRKAADLEADRELRCKEELQAGKAAVSDLELIHQELLISVLQELQQEMPGSLPECQETWRIEDLIDLCGCYISRATSSASEQQLLWLQELDQAISAPCTYLASNRLMRLNQARSKEAELGRVNAKCATMSRKVARYDQVLEKAKALIDGHGVPVASSAAGAGQARVRPAEEPLGFSGATAMEKQTAIKTVHRRLAVMIHPDKNKDPSAAAAYALLRDALEKLEKSF